MYGFIPIPNVLNYLGQEPSLQEKIIIAGTLAIIIIGISVLIKISELTYKKIMKK